MFVQMIPQMILQRYQRHSIIWSLALVFFALSLFAGCQSTTTDPENQPEAVVQSSVLDDVSDAKLEANLRSGFYPLQFGNQWLYERNFEVQIIPDNGPEPPETALHSLIESEIIGTEELFGRRYVVQQNRETEDAGDTFFTWLRFRQDRSGLYEADVSIGEPPTLILEDDGGLSRNDRQVAKSAGSLLSRLTAKNPELAREPYRTLLVQHLERHTAIRAVLGLMPPAADIAGPPGGPQSDELTRLRYPLRRGNSWVIRDAPLFTSTVVGSEILHLPIGRRHGVRIRITPPGTSENDEVFLWYSRCGRLRFFAHIESTATDESGNPIGTFISTDEDVLSDLDLRRRRGCERP